MPYVLKKLGRRDEPSGSRTEAVAAAANESSASGAGNAAPAALQSTLGNAAVARSLTGQQGGAPGADAAAASAAGTKGNPSLFKFTTVVPHATPGKPGGWQETGLVTLKFFYWPRSSTFPNWWSSTLVVGVPVENFEGPVDPYFAAVESAYAADFAEKSLLDGRQVWFGELDFGPAFRKKMREVLAAEIPGARVNSY